MCKHSYDLHSHSGKYHIDTCSLCGSSKRKECTLTSEHDKQYHWEVCSVCNEEINKEAHNVNTLNVTQTKSYKYGDLLDKEAITKEVIRLDGRESILAPYSGEEEDLGNGLFAYRYN